jgi:hypothetical protein
MTEIQSREYAPCVACGGRHGSVTSEVTCLRDRVLALQKTLLAWDAIRVSVKALPPFKRY